MSKDRSEKKKRKRLEKKRAKRKEKIKHIQQEKNRPLSELPFNEALITSDWKEARLADVFVSRFRPGVGIVFCDFLVDFDGFGLKDCFGPRNLTLQEYKNYIAERDFEKKDPATVSAIVHDALKWSKHFNFRLPKDTRKIMSILPEPGKCPVEFGRDGEPFLSGDEADVLSRIAQSGHKPEDFNYGTIQTSSHDDGQGWNFISKEYLAEHDKDDPLVRLEQLSVLANSYEESGKKEKAGELYSTMREIADKAGRLTDFLRYFVKIQISNEQMEAALKTYEQIIEFTSDPEKKAFAQIDLADFSGYLGDALGADEIYQKVLTKFPHIIEIHARYADFLATSARKGEAKEKYGWIIAELEDNEENKKFRALAFQKLYNLLKEEGDKSGAKTLYKQAKKEMKIKLR